MEHEQYIHRLTHILQLTPEELAAKISELTCSYRYADEFVMTFGRLPTAQETTMDVQFHRMMANNIAFF